MRWIRIFYSIFIGSLNGLTVLRRNRFLFRWDSYGAKIISTIFQWISSRSRFIALESIWCPYSDENIPNISLAQVSPNHFKLMNINLFPHHWILGYCIRFSNKLKIISQLNFSRNEQTISSFTYNLVFSARHFDLIESKLFIYVNLFMDWIEETNSDFICFYKRNGRSFQLVRIISLYFPKTNPKYSFNYLYSWAMKNVPLISQPFGFFRLPLNTFL